MAILNIDAEKNSILLLRGNQYFIDKESEKEYDKTDYKDFITIEHNKELVGLEISEYLSKPELKALKSEKKFKDFLELHNIPFLYIGQGLNGIEQSITLTQNTKSRRPDFLVNLPDLGIIFIDVKCRKQTSFYNHKKKYFQLFEEEIIGLWNLQNSLLVPVWVAFVEEPDIFFNKKRIFKTAPISLIKSYYDSLKSKLGLMSEEIISYRIPNEFMTIQENGLSFKIGIRTIDEEIVTTFVDYYIALIRRMKEEINIKIRKKEVLKTNLSEELMCDVGEFILQREINHIIKMQITKGDIIYKERKPLKLRGEN